MALVDQLQKFEPEQRVVGFDEAGQLVGQLQRDGVPVILAQGVFDLIHMGHAGYLQAASRLGVLIVGVENDASVRHNKGVTRPINTGSERMALLSHLRTVDLIFEYENTPDYNEPSDFIGRYLGIHPDAIAVASWDPHIHLKAWQAEQAGTVLAPLDYRFENSTTAMLRRIGYEE